MYIIDSLHLRIQKWGKMVIFLVSPTVHIIILMEFAKQIYTKNTDFAVHKILSTPHKLWIYCLSSVNQYIEPYNLMYHISWFLYQLRLRIPSRWQIKALWRITWKIWIFILLKDLQNLDWPHKVNQLAHQKHLQR